MRGPRPEGDLPAAVRASGPARPGIAVAATARVRPEFLVGLGNLRNSSGKQQLSHHQPVTQGDEGEEGR